MPEWMSRSQRTLLVRRRSEKTAKRAGTAERLHIRKVPSGARKRDMQKSVLYVFFVCVENDELIKEVLGVLFHDKIVSPP